MQTSTSNVNSTPHFYVTEAGVSKCDQNVVPNSSNCKMWTIHSVVIASTVFCRPVQVYSTLFGCQEAIVIFSQ